MGPFSIPFPFFDGMANGRDRIGMDGNGWDYFEMGGMGNRSKLAKFCLILVVFSKNRLIGWRVIYPLTKTDRFMA